MKTACETCNGSGRVYGDDDDEGMGPLAKAFNTKACEDCDGTGEQRE